MGGRKQKVQAAQNAQEAAAQFAAVTGSKTSVVREKTRDPFKGLDGEFAKLKAKSVE